MLNGTAPVMKAASLGALRAVGSGREVASRNQKRTAYLSGKYDFFGSAQHSFGRWLKRCLRGSFLVLIVLMLPACVTISEEDNLLFRNMYDLARSRPSRPDEAPTPGKISRCQGPYTDELIHYLNVDECITAMLEYP